MKRCPFLILVAALAAMIPCLPAGAQDAPPASPAAPAAAHGRSGAAFVPFPGGVDPSTVTRDQLGANLVVTGTIAKFEPSSGERVPHRITLFEEGDRVFEVVYWPDVAARVHGENGALPFVGQKISVKGKVGEYREKLQIRVSNPKTIRLEGFNEADDASSASAASAPAGADAGGVLTVTQALALPDSSKPLTVEGEVASFKPSWGDKAPNLLRITDGESDVEVVFFPNENVVAPEELTKPGAKVQILARRSDYNGKTQLKMLPGKEIRPAGSKPEGGAGAPVSPDRVVNSGDIDTVHVGKTITVAGTLEGVVPAAEGRYAIVRDRDGVVFVFIGEDLKGADLEAKLASGNRLKVRGEVAYSQLRSQLVIVPKGGDSLTVAKGAE